MLKNSVDNLINLCNSRFKKNEIVVNEFVAIFIIYGILPSIVWQNDSSVHGHLLKLVSGMLCIAMFSREYWAYDYRKYLGCLWYLTIFISIPFTNYTIVFNNELEYWSILNLTCGMLLLAALIDWDFFVFFQISGMLSSALYSSVIHQKDIQGVIFTEAGGWLFFALSYQTSVVFLLVKKYGQYIDVSLFNAKKASGVLCHEVKNLLSTLNLITINMQNKLEREPGKIAIYSDKIKIIVSDMYTLVDDLLLKINLDKRIELEMLTVNKMLEEALVAFSSKKEGDMKIDIKTREDFNVLANKVLFQTIIINLMKNSWKHAPKTNGYLKIYAEETSLFNIMVFEDNGEGIKSTDIPFIFKVFYSRRKEGVGLGLYFCREAMQKMGGDILCESEPGVYTKFKLLFLKVSNEDK